MATYKEWIKESQTPRTPKTTPVGFCDKGISACVPEREENTAKAVRMKASVSNNGDNRDISMTPSELPELIIMADTNNNAYYKPSVKARGEGEK